MDEVLKLLQHIRTSGVPIISGKHSTRSGLSWWKRWVNSWRIWDRRPFEDPLNHRHVTVVEIKTMFNLSKIEQFMRENFEKPKCKYCGSENLDADPAGYYCDATDWNGAPLLCLDCGG
jgi:hypothetical protein